MLSPPVLEIRTRSVPTAGHLLALGFEPLGIVMHPSGTTTFRFSPDAREALERFLLAKQRLDAWLGRVVEEVHGRAVKPMTRGNAAHGDCA